MVVRCAVAQLPAPAQLLQLVVQREELLVRPVQALHTGDVVAQSTGVVLLAGRRQLPERPGLTERAQLGDLQPDQVHVGVVDRDVGDLGDHLDLGEALDAQGVQGAELGIGTLLHHGHVA